MLDPRDGDEMMDRLRGAFPRARSPGIKGGGDPFRAVVSCILSAQSLDRNTAAAAGALLALADTPRGLRDLDEAALIDAIRPAGPYNRKARSLKKMCRALLEDHGGVVPRDRAGVMSLPGVGRKCADIVLAFTFGEAVVAVDTHVHRVCNRIGLARGRTEAQTARDLDTRLPERARRDGHVLLLTLGKRICTARAPRCPDGPVADPCEADAATQ